ncbi:MAG: outer membrane lipoprotein carrier protein LolA [Candidatus Electrothrix aestuarii]|uniref:Outer membrane lipoprotein carrier protein LolA n=1 Tax=Candidatus Electrothrix aestuarii TaxID=3062594 RepID=A0AAU8LRT8_9BACT|nr:outer membrane lipoprotein carrier protein LolA [Candidatus Electrothrix aestuarii]
MLKQITSRIILVFSSLLLLCVFSVQSQGASVPLHKLEKIQQFYRELNSLSFDFKQITNSNGRTREGAGKSVFYRPSPTTAGIMRWDYTQPGQQIIVNDGKELSIYTAKDKQLLIMSAKKLQSDITYSFFIGKRNFKEDFTLLPADSRYAAYNNVQTDIAVQLVPKQPHGQIKSLHFWFDKDSKIKRIIMEDHFDTTTELLFSNIQFNTLPADSPQTVAQLIRLNIPSDTEIIRQ